MGQIVWKRYGMTDQDRDTWLSLLVHIRKGVCLITGRIVYVGWNIHDCEWDILCVRQ